MPTVQTIHLVTSDIAGRDPGNIFCYLAKTFPHKLLIKVRKLFSFI